MVPIREPKRYSILLADDLALVREGLAALCDTQPHLKVVGQCSEGAVALRIIEAERPDIAVLDLNLTDLFTLEIVKRVREANRATRIGVLSPPKAPKPVPVPLPADRRRFEHAARKRALQVPVYRFKAAKDRQPFGRRGLTKPQRLLSTWIDRGSRALITYPNQLERIHVYSIKRTTEDCDFPAAIPFWDRRAQCSLRAGCELGSRHSCVRRNLFRVLSLERPSLKSG